MIVDAHAHLYHPTWYPKQFNDYLIDAYMAHGKSGADHRQAKEIIETILCDDSGDITISVMNKVGIDRRVIAILDWGLALGEASKSIRQIHEEILGICARFPSRLVGLAGIDPTRPNALEILEWAFDTLGARGLKLHPTAQWSLDDRRTHRLVDATASRGFPILIHSGRTMPILKDKYSQPDAILALAKAFPAALLIAGHAGFEQWRIFTQEAPLLSNLYCDISGWQDMVGTNWAYMKSSLLQLCAAMPGRVCFGSDSPFFTHNLVASEKMWVRAVTENAPAEHIQTVLANPIFCATAHEV